MISKDVVFILGAGASNTYKYPLGVELVKIICSNLENISSQNQERSNFEILQDFGYSAGNLLNFRNELIYSDTPSIDSFLEHRKEYLELGKLAIAQALIPFEITDNLFNTEQSWYKYIFEKLSSSFVDFDKNRVSFITFNYDRSLEHYLMTALQHKYGKTASECADKFKKIQIMHLYGQLSMLPWQTDDENSSREYGPLITPDIIKKSSSSLKIIYETPNDPEFREAFHLIMNVERVYFLGFGYNETNLQRLSIRPLGKGITSLPEFFGTSYKLTYEQRNRIPSRFRIRFFNEDLNVYDFLTQKIILE